MRDREKHQRSVGKKVSSLFCTNTTEFFNQLKVKHRVTYVKLRQLFKAVKPKLLNHYDVLHDASQPSVKHVFCSLKKVVRAVFIQSFLCSCLLEFINHSFSEC